MQSQATASAVTEGRAYWWEDAFDEIRCRYRSAQPFPHVIIDTFLEPDRGRRIVDEEFADVGSPRWTYHRHFSQKTYSRSAFDSFQPTTRGVFERVAGAPMVDFVQQLTGITGLFLPLELEDGGLAACCTGGFANIHADMTVHPTEPNWLRRVNLLWYLNEDWQASYGGELELWDAQMRRCVQRIAPSFNRCVIFESHETTLHGYPDRLQCPPEQPRKSIAFYYFTVEAVPPRRHFFDYYARPGEGLRHLGVAIDNRLIHTYERLRHVVGIDDRAINRAMRFFGIGRQ